MQNPALTIRPDRALHDAIASAARAEGVTMNTYICAALRGATDRRDRLRSQLGLARDATSDQVTAALEDLLEDFERRDAAKIKDPAARARFVARRIERKAAASKPARDHGTKPARDTGSRPAPPARRAAGPHWLLSADAMQARAARELRGPVVSARAVAEHALPLTVEDGVATIRVAGVLTPSPDAMAEIYGEPNTTYPDLQDALADALADASVTSIVWSIDSPGGSVDGLFELLDDIADARDVKPMSVLTSNAHSAAYGIAAAVGRITATSRLASFGSVGVATSAFTLGPMIGTSHHITNTDSPEKRPDVGTPEGKAVVVRYLDQIGDEFFASIAKGRGVKADVVRAGYGRGSSMLAPAALAAKLIDGIAPRTRRGESERAELERLRGVRVRVRGEADLADFERRDAAKIKDPAARARFVAKRLARKASK